MKSFERTSYQISQYKPVAISQMASDITSEIKSTSNNLMDLEDALRSLSRSVGSGAFNGISNNLQGKVNDMRKEVSVKCGNAVQDILDVTKAIATINNKYSSDLQTIKSNIETCEIELESIRSV